VEGIEEAFAPEGKLSKAIPGFAARSAQIALASAIAKAIEEKSILVAEAGTGTGKTFAYLLPCLLSGKKTLISTATKTLQDQLFQKDLPTLIRALGLSKKIQNLKGRSNYLCRHRIALHWEEGRFISPQSAHEIAIIQQKLPRMIEGERSELTEINEDSPVWPYVTSTIDNCLGTECPDFQSCFLVKARRRAMEADVVVINHHLFLADTRLKDEGLGELLPNFEVIIFDEAHQLSEIASHFYGERLSTRQIKDLLQDLLKEWPVLDLANRPLKQISRTIEQSIENILITLPQEEEKLGWERVKSNKAFVQAWENLLQYLDELLVCIEEADLNDNPGVLRCAERLQDHKKIAQHFVTSNQNLILWLERFKQTLIFHATPYDVSSIFKKFLKTDFCTYIFTSATLSVASSFSNFTKPLGLESAETLLLPSPFEFQKQALLYLPRGLPDPKNPYYYEVLIDKVLPLINALEGKCFFLFTSYKALKLVAQLLSNTLNYPLLVQGEEAKPLLLARFRQLGNAVLLGTATFWEGVDVKGEALSCVIIDKIPFASPVDPVIKGKMAYLKSQGLSGFDELSLPQAVLALKQGVGRLIRDADDKGVLMIADPRLTSRDYGRQIFASLPTVPKTREEKTVLHFIKELALNHDLISD
jgi:ATP-dependent DNA helicase DinG